MQFEHPAPFTPKWRGRWIWFERPPIEAVTATRPTLMDKDDRVGLFRRVIDLTSVPESAPARVWADGRFLLRINGFEVARGPVRSDPKRNHYDVVDLAPYLVEGRNVLALTARHFGTATAWWMPAAPTYTIGGGSIAFEAQIGDEWVVSDRSWQCTAGEAWTPVAAPGDVASFPLESFDSRRHPHGWESAGFDDGEWAAARELTPMHTGAWSEPRPSSDPFGMLRPPVRVGFQDGASHPATLLDSANVAGATVIEDPVRQVLDDEAAGGTGDVLHLRFDLEHIAAGNVEMSVRGAPIGMVIDVAASEHVDGAGNLVPLGQHSGLRYVCSGGDERFEGLDVIGTRYLNASVRSAADSTPEIAIAIHDRLRPRPEGASFECSDPDLQRIFEIGLRTVDLSALDAYVDCPTREQRAWTGDSVVHQSVDLVTNPDWSMPRWHPQLAAAARVDGMLSMAAASDFAEDDRAFVPDWSLHWIRSVHNIYRYMGDRELIAELLPVAERTLRWFESYLADDGLLEWVDGWLLLDWSSVYSTGKSSILNALWARALDDYVEMAEWLDNSGAARWARERRAGVVAAFDLFWDEGRGRYLDHVRDGVAHRAASQAASAAAIAAGLVPDDRHESIVAAMTDRENLIQHAWYMDTVNVEGQSSGAMYMALGAPEPDWEVERQMVECEPFFRYVVHDALALAGRADLVEDACRDWMRFVDRGESSWPECWAGGTRCHGWASTPTRDLIVYTLGISPAEPGYASVRVDPQLGSLEWAKASVPTPHGFVHVEAYADGRVEVDSPVPVVRG
ncbi:MAG: alpha-L-rhamnosidase N-terminal domain-containing protein [Acidimicrobiales bacterium]|nr:alpha-L-rhamnosidase N-terminal domain-containing protein [Acidimicrobiales bacterium]